MSVCLKSQLKEQVDNSVMMILVELDHNCSIRGLVDILRSSDELKDMMSNSKEMGIFPVNENGISQQELPLDEKQLISELGTSNLCMNCGVLVSVDAEEQTLKGLLEHDKNGYEYSVEIKEIQDIMRESEMLDKYSKPKQSVCCIVL